MDLIPFGSELVIEAMEEAHTVFFFFPGTLEWEAWQRLIKPAPVLLRLLFYW